MASRNPETTPVPQLTLEEALSWFSQEPRFAPLLEFFKECIRGCEASCRVSRLRDGLSIWAEFDYKSNRVRISLAEGADVYKHMIIWVGEDSIDLNIRAVVNRFGDYKYQVSFDDHYPYLGEKSIGILFNLAADLDRTVAKLSSE